MSLRHRAPGDERGEGAREDVETTVTGLEHDAAEGFATACEAVRHARGDADAWATLEARAFGPVHTEQIAALYREVLASELEPSVALALAERAVRFHDEWVDGAQDLVALVGRALDVAPTAEWALDRAALLLTSLARWDDLLAIYDRAILAESASARRILLLEEAAHVAKDCAGQVDRAIDYLGQIVELDRADAENAASLERLLSQQRRYPDLIDLWTRRAEVVPPEQALELQERIAVCRLESLEDAAGALAAVEPLLAVPNAAGAACRLLERVIAARASTPETRRSALGLLRTHYDAAGRHGDIVRALEAVLELSAGADRLDAHAELARRFVEQGEDDRALDHFAALLVLDAATCDDRLLANLLSERFTGTFAGATPRVDRARGKELLHRAARLATQTPGARDRAVHLYRVLLADAPDDLVAIACLAAVHEASGERIELRALRRHELGVTTDAPRRLLLRLDIARLSEALGDPAARVEALRENLDEQADHRRSIEELTGALSAEGRVGDLCDLLSAHAAKLETLGAIALAAELWMKAAALAETGLRALRRAVHGYERVVALAPGPEALDALARIHGELGEHEAAVACLERCVDLSPPSGRTDVVRRLAEAYVAAGRRDDALGCLARGLAADPGARPLRALEVGLLRAGQEWEALVATLLAGARHAEGRAQLAFLLEAADLLSHELQAPERAVPIFEQAVGSGAREISVRADLADALRRIGRLDEARAAAEALVAEYGRRRPPARAGVHLTLARTLRAQGDTDAAIAELEHAVSMDMGSAPAQRLLGDLCREAGLHERAERAYQALLLVQRRQRAHATEASPVQGMSETLYLLHVVAKALGDETRATETLASAFDTARRSEPEARRLERALRKSGSRELLLRALDQRLEAVEDGPTRIALLGETASILEALDRAGEALDRALRGLAIDPDDADLHGRARALGVRARQGARYVAALEAMVEAASQAGRGAAACAHLLRLGAVYEDDLGQLDAAASVYERAEATSEGLVEVWRRMVRVATARGDRASRLSVLRKLADALSDAGSVEERAEALYALADEELQTVATVDAGLSSLSLALELRPQHALAVKALRKALRIARDPEPVTRLYVSVARAAGEPVTLLDALMAQSRLPAPGQEALEEAFALASSIGAQEQGARLLERAVEAALAASEPGEALWAMRRLGDESERAGDLPAAIGWMTRAADAADEQEATSLLMRVAELAAGPVGDVDLACRTYERLRERDPANLDVWRPLLDVLRAMDDPARLEAALEKGAEVVPLPGERNRLRMERARLLLRWPERAGDVLDVLRSVLDEEPEHEAAAALLADLLQSAGGHEELVALLGRQLDGARDRKDADAGAAIAQRLAGDLLSTSKPEAAADVYRSVLDWAPDRADVLRALVALLTGADDAAERADRLERLMACEAGTQRFDLALELARARRALTDAPGVERALAVAWATDPGHPEVRGRLRSLADATIAEASDHPGQAAPLLYKAALLLRDRVGDPKAALDVLRKTLEARPDDPPALALLVRCAIETGEIEAAAGAVAAALARAPEGPQEAELLRLRALVAAGADDHTAAWEDLERAFSLGGAGFLEDLLDEVPKARSEARDGGDAEIERALALRHAELLVLSDQADAACEVLAEWIGRTVDDREAIRRLVALDTAAGRWDDVAEGYGRLLDLEPRSELAAVAMALADACEKAGRPAAGCVGLERVFQSDPTNGGVRDRLKALYAEAGRDRELANLLLVEARHEDDPAARFDLLREAGRLRLQSLQEGAAAIGPLAEALDLRPADQPVTLLLADAYVAAGLVDEATEVLRAAIGQRGGKRSRELAELQHRMAGLADNRPAELSWLVAAFESFPKSPEICADLARAATELGQYEQALKGLRSVVSLKESTPRARATAYLMQARIASLQSDDRRAVFLARKALVEVPTYPEASALIEEIEGRS